jgi:predicted nicotinamide N-methyase
VAEEELVEQAIALPGGGAIRLLQPAESADLPDDAGVEWAPIAPYWSVLWRSGVALAQELAGEPLAGLRVVEVGCGLGVPSLVAARAGASVLATDADPEALELLARNAELNGCRLQTAMVDWQRPDELVARGPFDLALAADVLYEAEAIAPLLGLLPRLAPTAWVADPGRAPASAFLERAKGRWRAETRNRGVVRLHHLTATGR